MTGQPIVRIQLSNDAWDRRVRDGSMVSRSGREIEDVARRPLDYSRGVSSYDPAGMGRITPREYVVPAKPAAPVQKTKKLKPAVSIGAKLGLHPFGPFLPADEAEDDQTLALYRVADLMRALCRVCDCTRAELCGQSRTAHIVKSRQIGFWLMRQFSGRSLPYIGRLFGGRDHTTALYGARRCDFTIAQLGIPASDDPVEMMQRLSAAKWPRYVKGLAPLRIERRA